MSHEFLVETPLSLLLLRVDIAIADPLGVSTLERETVIERTIWMHSIQSK